LKPRIAFYDLENSPALGWYYDRYKEGNIVADEQDWFMLSFAWQWADEKKVHCKALCDYPGYAKNKTDDTPLIKDLHKLFDEADILIAHNGDRFDRRKSPTPASSAAASPHHRHTRPWTRSRSRADSSCRAAIACNPLASS
jgi:hypothetical protein